VIYEERKKVHICSTYLIRRMLVDGKWKAARRQQRFMRARKPKSVYKTESTNVKAMNCTETDKGCLVHPPIGERAE
jgi:hypothetical protein